MISVQPQRRVERPSDMCNMSLIYIEFKEGIFTVGIKDPECPVITGVEFCSTYNGGGKSQYTRDAMTAWLENHGHKNGTDTEFKISLGGKDEITLFSDAESDMHITLFGDDIVKKVEEERFDDLADNAVSFYASDVDNDFVSFLFLLMDAMEKDSELR